MRVLAIGDIHGHLAALRALEAFVPLLNTDRIVTIGDYVDRGPDSRGVLDWMIARKSQDRVISLRGNHELMMCAAKESPRHFDEWIACGGDTALRSYAASGTKGRLEDVPSEHWRFMKNVCRAFYETPTHFFVHANAYPDMPLEEQPDFMLYWEQFHDTVPHENGKIMICGHTPQRDGRPRNIGHAVCIDTAIHSGGWLTCLDVQSGDYWQADQQGRTRRGEL